MTSGKERNRWNRDQLLIALRAYCELPFGRMHSKNEEIQRIAKALGRTPSAVAMKLVNIASLDPAIRSSGRKGLTGASIADASMWQEMTTNWLAFSLEANEAAKRFHLDKLHRDEFVETEAEAEEESANYVGEMREANVAIRVGQALFRKSVLSAYDYKCCITGISTERLLVASHIVPWKHDVQNRLNPRNGLCLSAIHDRAFDAGLISLTDDHRVMVSKHIRAGTNSFIQSSFLFYESKKIMLPEKFFPDPQFLSFHRREIFHA